jgi:hypothetical protein
MSEARIIATVINHTVTVHFLSNDTVEIREHSTDKLIHTADVTGPLEAARHEAWENTTRSAGHWPTAERHIVGQVLEALEEVPELEAYL